VGRLLRPVCQAISHTVSGSHHGAPSARRPQSCQTGRLLSLSRTAQPENTNTHPGHSTS
jgi:hypothetical protein